MSTVAFNPPIHVPSYRLTRRGRLVVLLVGLVVVIAVGVAFASGSVATSRDGGTSTTSVVRVQPGETLWDVASQASSGGDVRGMMQRIEDLNALDESFLQAGQRLLVPTDG